MQKNVTPVIGLTTYREPSNFAGWNLEATLLPVSYIDSVYVAGGAPVLLPSLAGLQDCYLDRIDALLLTGGSDIDPAIYAQEPHAKAGQPRRIRDDFELELLRGALERKIPILAICRGLQILNVLRGGTLHQHLPDVVGNQEHDSVPGGFGRHKVVIEAPSRIAEIIGETTVEVPAHHHQAIDVLGQNLAIAASSDDGTIEAIEDPQYPFLIAVQWHPEVGSDKSLFEALVRVARNPS